MNQRQYYTLIAGLPELVPEQTKVPFTLADWTQSVSEILHPDDYQQLHWLLLPYSHPLVLHNEEITAHPLSPFSREILEEQHREPGQLPPYIDRFLTAKKDDQPVWPELSWENQLTRLYFEYALEATSGFLFHWLQFDQHLRNLLAAWNSRELKWELDGVLIGQNEVNQALRRSHQRDFGLTKEYPFLFRLIPALEQGDLLEREKATLRLKWEFIDEALTFHYFSVEVVIGYFLKLQLLERRLKFDQKEGQAILRRAIEQLEQKAEKYMQKPANL